MRALWVVSVLAANLGRCQSTEVPPVGEGESTSAFTWGAPDVVLPGNPTVSANFGNALAVHGEFAIAGAPNGETNATLGGAAYVLLHSPLGWGAVQQLTVAGLNPYDEFGFAVGMDADHACVGAPQRVTQGPGRALVYDRASNWTKVVEVQPSNLWSSNLGWACAVDGDTLVVSDASYYDVGISGGAAFVFDRVGTSWTQSGLLHQGNLTGTETLGNSVAISGDTVVVGSWPFGTDIGGAYVYERVAGVWQSTATLLPSVPVAGARFGYSVGVSGDVIVVGAFTDDGGAAYVYERTGGNWVEKQILANGANLFGFSVAIHGRRLAVGSNSGVFVYEHVGDEWVPAPELPPPTVPDFSFGRTVALGSSTLLVGAPAGSLGGELQSGTVYAFGMTLELGDGCDVDADCSEGFCVDGVCCNELCGGNGVDDCMACSVAAGSSVGAGDGSSRTTRRDVHRHLFRRALDRAQADSPSPA